jgi:hypothetical protein
MYIMYHFGAGFALHYYEKVGQCIPRQCLPIFFYCPVNYANQLHKPGLLTV